MNLLLDSHALIWAMDNPPKLSATVVAAMQAPANKLFVSTATCWEIAIKASNRKLPLSMSYRSWIDQSIASLDLRILDITLEHLERQFSLPFHHNDPFDRLLSAQSLVEGMPLVSIDAIFDAYGVTRIWQ